MANNTPFFQAFGALLFGRRPRKVIGNVKQLGSLGELYELFGDMLPDHLLARCWPRCASDPVPERPGRSEPTCKELPLTNPTKVRNAGSASPQQAAASYPKVPFT